MASTAAPASSSPPSADAAHAAGAALVTADEALAAGRYIDGVQAYIKALKLYPYICGDISPSLALALRLASRPTGEPGHVGLYLQALAAMTAARRQSAADSDADSEGREEAAAAVGIAEILSDCGALLVSLGRPLDARQPLFQAMAMLPRYSASSKRFDTTPAAPSLPRVTPPSLPPSPTSPDYELQQHALRIGAVARASLEAITNRLVQRWHFRMLNDAPRNLAYQRAISRAVAAQSKLGEVHVLDIGAGTGLLSMYAVQAGAHKVTACEASPAMQHIAAHTLAANGCSKRVTLVPLPSTSLTVPGHMPRRADIIVAEVVDSGLLGESILPTMRHAATHLLARSRTACCIPAAATVYAQLLSCPRLRHQRTLTRCCCDTHPKPRPWLPTGAAVPGVVVTEPYTCDQLARLPGATLLTAATPVMTLRLDGRVSQSPVKTVTQFKASKSGPIDAVAIWWTLELDKETTLSNAPGSDTNWDQALFYMPSLDGPGASALKLATRGLQVAAGSTVDLHVSAGASRLHMWVEGATSTTITPRCCSCATGASAAAGAGGGAGAGAGASASAAASTAPSTTACEVSEKTMAALNDSVWNAALCTQLAAIKAPLPAVLDLSECLTVASLAVARLGMQSTLCGLKDATEASTLVAMATAEQCTHKPVAGSGNVVAKQDTASDAVLAILPDLIEQSGVVRETALPQLVSLMQARHAVHPLVLPAAIAVVARPMACPELRSHRAVDPGRVQLPGANMEAVNQFWVRTHQDVDIDTLPHTRVLAADHCVLTIDLERLSCQDTTAASTSHSPPTDVTSTINAGVSAARSYRLPVAHSGTVNAVALWYQLQLSASVIVSTGPVLPSSSSTQRGSWRQAAVLLDKECTVVAGDKLVLTAWSARYCADVYFTCAVE